MLTGTFRSLSARGSIVGTVAAVHDQRRTRSSFRGTARFTSGTGAYRGITSGALQVRDHNTLDGQAGTVSVEGFATY